MVDNFEFLFQFLFVSDACEYFFKTIHDWHEFVIDVFLFGFYSMRKFSFQNRLIFIFLFQFFYKSVVFRFSFSGWGWFWLFLLRGSCWIGFCRLDWFLLLSFLASIQFYEKFFFLWPLFACRRNQFLFGNYLLTLWLDLSTSLDYFTWLFSFRFWFYRLVSWVTAEFFALFLHSRLGHLHKPRFNYSRFASFSEAAFATTRF